MDTTSFLQTGTAMDRHAKALAKVSGLVDRQLSPLGLVAINALEPKHAETILDVGCGAGQTLLQIAERVGPTGNVIGVDVADVLLSVARNRYTDVTSIQLIHADAQTLDLQSAYFDGVFSRFGVMGFADPLVAFKNFRRLLKAGGRLAFCCWRTLEENELDRFPIETTERQNEVRETPFSFADPSYVRELLKKAGFEGIKCEAHDEQVSCGGMNETIEVLLNVGALGQMVRETPSLRTVVEPRLRKALLPRANPNIELTAAIWIVSALAADI